MCDKILWVVPISNKWHSIQKAQACSVIFYELLYIWGCANHEKTNCLLHHQPKISNLYYHPVIDFSIKMLWVFLFHFFFPVFNLEARNHNSLFTIQYGYTVRKNISWNKHINYEKPSRVHKKLSSCKIWEMQHKMASHLIPIVRKIIQMR